VNLELQLLYEPPGLPALDLPEELARRYGGTLGFAGRRVVANFVQTVDGVVAIPALEQSNRLISEASEADRFTMALLRAAADAILIGSGTLQASPRSLWLAAATSASAWRTTRATDRPPTSSWCPKRRRSSPRPAAGSPRRPRPARCSVRASQPAPTRS
jgi:hypothetical protein